MLVFNISGELWRFLERVYETKLPPPGLTFHLEYGQGQVFTSPIPNPLNLPSIPENRNLTEYYNAVDTNNMLIIFASMLTERRIIVTSKKLSRLSACVQAANSIIYPMSWQHIFIPVLPVQLMDYLCAPMPFLIGVPEPIMKRTRRSELGDVVILDADNNRVETPFDDLESLPSEVVSNLKKSLKSPANLLGESVARAFLQALVHLIGGYRDALKHRQGERITFSEDDFILSRSSSVQPFLVKMLELQIFRQFIEERLILLNSGKSFSDEFELECIGFTEKPNKKFTVIKQNVRKESGLLVKKVKNKANPAVKDAMKNVMDGSKIAKSKAKATYRDVKSRWNNKEEMHNESGPYSAPSSPVQSRSSTLNKYGTISNSQFPRQNTDLNFGRVLKYERFDPTSTPDGFSPDMEDLPRLEIDLMNDIDEILNRNKAKELPSTSSAQEPERTSGTSSRKSSVGDLINLGNESDDIIFDPLASSNSRSDQSSHKKKLSRTTNPYISVTNSTLPDRLTASAGKYENYVPPGGGNQPQFKQFLTSMTEQTQPSTRSSEDLLSEYGLHFSKMSVQSSQTPSPILYNTVFTPSPSLSQQPILSGSGASYSRPSFQTNGIVSSTPLVPPRVPSISKPNNSFLYNSPNIPASFKPGLIDSTEMPVNQRLPGTSDILAELDPLRKPTPSRSNPSPRMDPIPPAVPPRSKKQWTTFD